MSGLPPRYEQDEVPNIDILGFIKLEAVEAGDFLSSGRSKNNDAGLVSLRVYRLHTVLVDQIAERYSSFGPAL